MEVAELDYWRNCRRGIGVCKERTGFESGSLPIRLTARIIHLDHPTRLAHGSHTMEPPIKQIPAIPVISRTDRLTIPQIPAHSGPAVQSLIESLKQLGIPPIAGDMIYVYHGCNGDPTQEFDLEICLPVPSGLNLRLERPIELKTTTPFRCVSVDYVGPMSGFGAAWMNLVRWVSAAGHKPTGQSREIYKKWVSFNAPDNVTELQQGIE